MTPKLIDHIAQDDLHANHVMLDLETMGTTAGSAIIAIGAVLFRMDSKKADDDFYCTIDLQSAVDAGAMIRPSTVMWWMQQEDAARKAFTVGTISLVQALQRFAAFIPQDTRVWGNGATMDNVVLSSAYEMCGLQRPWSYKHDRCYRTIKALFFPGAHDFEGTKHNALDDARHQASMLLGGL